MPISIFERRKAAKCEGAREHFGISHMMELYRFAMHLHSYPVPVLQVRFERMRSSSPLLARTGTVHI